jgi:hypothetical protein
MLYAGLERAIQLGMAQYKTFALGIGGVARIPVPKGQFIIITAFDYFHFCDPVAEDGGEPAQASVSITFVADVTTNPCPGTFDFGAIGSFATTLDFTDAPGSLLQVDADLQAAFPGWSVGLVIIGGTTWVFTFTTTAPGISFNGEISNFTTAVIEPPVVVPGVFAGGTDIVFTVADVLAASVHQLEFRSTKSRNHFIIPENIQFYTKFLGYTVTNPVATITLTRGVLDSLDVVFYVDGVAITSSVTVGWFNGATALKNAINAAMLGSDYTVTEVTGTGAPSYVVTIESTNPLDSGMPLTVVWAPLAGATDNGPVLFSDAVSTAQYGTAWNVTGKYQRNTYLVHTESVAINIIKVPQPSAWTSATYSALSTKSQEDRQPVGYGQVAGGLNTVRIAEFSAGERYFPLTSLFEDFGTSAQQQFKVNAMLGRELADPTAIVFPDDQQNGRTFPVLNIEYVLVNKDYTDYVLPS